MSEEPVVTPQPVKEEEIKPNYEEIAISLYNENQELKFLSDQIRFNATLFQGFTLILDKLTKIEEKLNGPKQ